jgi:hypothetical protein
MADQVIVETVSVVTVEVLTPGPQGPPGTGTGSGSDPVEDQITAAEAKATPVDADTLALVDSEAAGVLKKLTWANLKATLKTYFDALYGAPLVTELPTPSATYRTQFRTLDGGVGGQDTLWHCQKMDDDDETYEWKEIPHV